MATLQKLSTMLLLFTCVTIGLGKNYTVKLVHNRFDPASLSVYEGDTITWINESEELQSLQSGSKCKPDGIWTSGNIESGRKYKYIFKKEGAITYFSSAYCTEGMKGFIMVNPRKSATFKPEPDINKVSSKGSYLNYLKEMKINQFLDAFKFDLDFIAVKPEEAEEL